MINYLKIMNLFLISSLIVLAGFSISNHFKTHSFLTSYLDFQTTRLIRGKNFNKISVYPPTIKINGKTLKTWILKVSPSEDVKVHLVANEKINGKRWIDWGNGIVYVGDKAAPLDASHDTFDELTTRGDREKLIEKFRKENPDKEIVAVLPNGNTMFNDWFVSYVNGKLLHNAKEPVFEREYSSLIVWKDGSISIKDIRFEEGEDKVKIWDVKQQKYIEDKVLYTTFGQRLVKNGEMVNPIQIYEQFDDLSHLFYLPVMPVKGKEVIGGPMVSKMHEDESLVKAALEGKAISFNLKQDLKGIKEDELRKRLNDSGYTEVVKEGGIANQGEYALKDNLLTIKLIRNQYRHFIAGVKDGKFVTISILGESGSHGATVEEAAEIAKRQGLKDAILLCNGRDVWLNYKGKWVEDTGRRGISSVILITKDKQE